MNCQHGHCDYTARTWVTKGGRAKKICNTHLEHYTTTGWSLR